jgi:hypothetical protein
MAEQAQVLVAGSDRNASVRWRRGRAGRCERPHSVPTASFVHRTVEGGMTMPVTNRNSSDLWG